MNGKDDFVLYNGDRVCAVKNLAQSQMQDSNCSGGSAKKPLNSLDGNRF